MGVNNRVWLESCTIVKRAERAVLVQYEGLRVWLPLSQIDDPDRLKEGDVDVTIGIPEWLALEKGLEVD